ncbi:1,4-dihydroxy-2-naphthoate polyprenyltransferase [Companilactobacillus alimentarius]|uniref:Prenyltransferase n=1 Tax=Companilactobacillus alimentarius DSM 20249 TaxID=1423720 RepID=A0A2K9HIJ8_9LACO|nr:prenyltransferase [Companilactobacillus alimentarius]AUI72381.1 hypothetical protein LA20249_09380 [Companilactobacillus alimentarius DSM 20249]KRK76594.1 1,4-dihydroxy-2-naphthoate octaprenyltransferase [Companilactobacillus alimentarius DSM 20249]MDT6952967.1 prenyltransferase [Companilactobacillus alimentarius]GEO45769.1 1,4-dihydroxy-2-naphthoate octaprenyltransferase [Companilactobacillus alimentarius]
MTVKDFFDLTKIYSAVTSVMPTLLGFMFVGVYYRDFNLGLSILLFIAVVLFHLAVNVHNQYVDYYKYQKQPDVFKNSVNNTLNRRQISPQLAFKTMSALAIISAIIGLYLVFQTGFFILVVGLISFAIGYLYSGGRKSIAYSPFGEVVSGLTMGYNITLLAVYVNFYNDLNFEWSFIWKTALVSLVAVFAISNIMLANNISDASEDLKVGRKTLVAYLGQEKSKLVWVVSYFVGYLAVLSSVVLGYLPWYCLAFLVVTSPLVVINSIKFIKKPSKALTFVNSVKNAQILLVSVLVGGLISFL